MFHAVCHFVHAVGAVLLIAVLSDTVIGSFTPFFTGSDLPASAITHEIAPEMMHSLSHKLSHISVWSSCSASIVANAHLHAAQLLVLYMCLMSWCSQLAHHCC